MRHIRSGDTSASCCEMLSPTLRHTNQKEKNCCQVTFPRGFESNRPLRAETTSATVAYHHYHHSCWIVFFNFQIRFVGQWSTARCCIRMNFLWKFSDFVYHWTTKCPRRLSKWHSPKLFSFSYSIDFVWTAHCLFFNHLIHFSTRNTVTDSTNAFDSARLGPESAGIKKSKYDNFV